MLNSGCRVEGYTRDYYVRSWLVFFGRCVMKILGMGTPELTVLFCTVGIPFILIVVVIVLLFLIYRNTRRR